MIVVSFLVNPGKLELERPLGTFWEISMNEMKAQENEAYFETNTFQNGSNILLLLYLVIAELPMQDHAEILRISAICSCCPIRAVLC